MKKDRIKRLYGIAMAAMVVLCGGLLCVQCVRLCASGQPFSRDAVAACFSPIALPVFLCAAMVPLGFLLPGSARNGKGTGKPAVLSSGKNPLRTLLLTLGLSMGLWGILTGGTEDVLTKAINICTECVGLG